MASTRLVVIATFMGIPITNVRKGTNITPVPIPSVDKIIPARVEKSNITHRVRMSVSIPPSYALHTSHMLRSSVDEIYYRIMCSNKLRKDGIFATYPK